MQPHGKGLKLETLEEIDTVSAVLATALSRPHEKIADVAVRRNCGRMIGRFMPYIVFGVPLKMPQALSPAERRALTVASDVAVEHTATAVGFVADMAATMHMSRRQVLRDLVTCSSLFDNPEMLTTAMLATSANVEIVSELSAALSQINDPQPPATPPVPEA